MMPGPWPTVLDAECFKVAVPLPQQADSGSRCQQLSQHNLLLPAGPARQLILDKVAEDKSRILVWGMVTDNAGGQPYLQSAMRLLSISQLGGVAVCKADQSMGADDGQPYPPSTLPSALYEAVFGGF